MKRTVIGIVLGMVLGLVSYPAAAGDWEQLGSFNASAVYASDDAWVFATDAVTGQIYKCDLASKTWSWKGWPGAKFTTAPGHLYGLSPTWLPQNEQGVYSWEYVPNPGGSGGAMGWVRIRDISGGLFSGPAGVLATDAGGVVPGGTGDVFKYDGTPFSWGTNDLRSFQDGV